MAEQVSELEELDRYVSSVRQGFERMLGQLVEVPTVSADETRVGEIRTGAELAARYLESFGARAEIVETPGNPVVLAKLFTSPANPTITIYNHLDVQPARSRNGCAIHSSSTLKTVVTMAAGPRTTKAPP